MTNNLIAVDTNVLIYIHDSDSAKRQIAFDIVDDNPNISAQVISEYFNVCRRILPTTKDALLTQTANFFSDCLIIPITINTLHHAALLVKKYNFQLFDSIIVASALDQRCNILFSEDMHHNLIVENRLQIINPFL